MNCPGHIRITEIIVETNWEWERVWWWGVESEEWRMISSCDCAMPLKQAHVNACKLWSSTQRSEIEERMQWKLHISYRVSSLFKAYRGIKFESALLHVKISLRKWLCGINMCTYNSLWSISIYLCRDCEFAVMWITWLSCSWLWQWYNNFHVSCWLLDYRIRVFQLFH